MTATIQDVRGLAAAAIEDRNILPILADAMEECGRFDEAARAREFKMSDFELGMIQNSITVQTLRDSVDRYNEDAYREKPLSFFIPENWSLSDIESYTDSLLPLAVVAKLIDRGLEFDVNPRPKNSITTTRGGDSWGYRIYSDESLWYWNNAQDEVHSDVGYMVESLVDSIRDRNVEQFDDLPDADICLLIYYYKSREAAMESCGFEPEEDFE